MPLQRVQLEIGRIQDEIRSGNLVEVLTRFSDLILVSLHRRHDRHDDRSPADLAARHPAHS